MIRKLIMYVSAFLPMFVIMWVKEVLKTFRNALGKPTSVVWWKAFYNPYLIAELILIIVVGALVFILMQRNSRVGVYTIIVKSVKNRSAEYYLAYYSLFILALIEFSLTDPIDLVVLVMLMVVLGIVYIKNDLYFMNPTINIFRSFIYEVEYETDESTLTKLIISPERITEGNMVDIDISEFEFTFLRRKHENQK